MTPVSGVSWLKHLGLALDQTKMGQMGGEGGPPGTPRVESLPQTRSSPLGGAIRRFYSQFRRGRGRSQDGLNEPFQITGADLYRLDCRSCHGATGAGAPPEINSLLGPAEATSPALVERRMKDRGITMDGAAVKSLAADAERLLRDRLVHGGEKMPSFPHLQGEEVDALVAYLKKLAGVPASEYREVPVTESASRVGEHLIKGTCHICHDAVGPGSGHRMMMPGIIPSLASLPEQESPGEFIRKVRSGASSMIMMGMTGADRMPAFGYVTEEEAAAAYLYLARYPPRPAPGETALRKNSARLIPPGPSWSLRSSQTLVVFPFARRLRERCRRASFQAAFLAQIAETSEWRWSQRTKSRRLSRPTSRSFSTTGT
ncbi:MAG: c-type cytochrome [Acidobacteriota bacterium]